MNADNPSVSNAEDREFKVDKNILFDLVFKQANSVSGALSELVMNSIDAGANNIEIQLTLQGFKVVDDGVGFKLKDEIVKFFEVFGLPREQLNDEAFGRFRMGRGQIMGYAKTTWNSNRFRMDVDIKEHGLNYVLTELPNSIVGCCVGGEWYNKISDINWASCNDESKQEEASLNNLIETLGSRFEYMQDVNIVINGVHVNNSEVINWDFEDDVIMLKGTFDSPSNYIKYADIYNLGSHVDRLHTSRFSGVVISKKHMKINMTRSEVQSDCPIFIHIKKTIKKLTPKLNPKKKYSAERAFEIFNSMFHGDVEFEDISNLMLFCDIRKSRYYSLQDLTSSTFAFGLTEDYLSDYIHVTNKAIVLHPSTNTYHFDHKERTLNFLDKLVVWSEGAVNNNKEIQVAIDKLQEQHKTIDDIASQLNLENEIVMEEDLQKNEKLKLLALKSLSSPLSNLVARTFPDYEGKWYVRDLCVGVSRTAEAWTDGRGYIAINRNQLALLDKGTEGAFKLLTLMVHEYCHQDDDEFHNYNFYHRFHEILSHYNTYDFVNKILLKYDDLLAKHKIKPSRKMVKAMSSIRRNGISKAEIECAK